MGTVRATIPTCIVPHKYCDENPLPLFVHFPGAMEVSEGPLDRTGEAGVFLAELLWNGCVCPRLVSPVVVRRVSEVIGGKDKSANSEASCRQFGDVWLLLIDLGAVGNQKKYENLDRKSVV